MLQVTDLEAGWHGSFCSSTTWRTILKSRSFAYFPAGILPRGVSLSTTDVRPGVGPFCNGQITWEDGPSSGRTDRRAY